MKSYATGIVFEGIPGTGKSTIIKNLLKSEKYLEREFMPFFTYGEDITQRVLEDKHNRGMITKEDNLNLLDDILASLERYNSYYIDRDWSKDETEHRFGFILERFHLTHSTYFNHIEWRDLEYIDDRLNRLNTKLCLFKMRREVMEERIIESRCDRWRSYISRFGKTNEEIIDYYYKKQEVKEELVRGSNLESIIIDTSGGNWEEITKEVLDFWRI
ncbi:hypothetical protein [Halonatronum saccharophilum]|uniref:hypothetical protein n=1 Tax=Halonatronum saccharophilum TaxID=150060 RepID=UPI0004866A67|nr:hypothetical protein [Halonatronum saccharophilum]